MTAPIALFDSGLGGLTVLKGLYDQFPGENYVYLGDTERLPYGNKSEKTILNYLRTHLDFFVAQKPKALIIACNSASSAYLSHPFTSNFPIFEVITQGARQAAKISKTRHIGVIGTRATIHRRAYEAQLKQIDSSIVVTSQIGPLLVPLVEEGWIDDPLTNLILHRYLSSIKACSQIDTLILGCTHYPVLAASIRKVVGPDLQLVDSRPGLLESLTHMNLLTKTTGRGFVQLYITDSTPQYADMARRILNFEPEYCPHPSP